MPHIRPIYAADDKQVGQLLQTHKTKIREFFAYWLHYKPAEVAWIPEPISQERMELTDNLLRLEFVIDTGKSTSTTDERVKAIRDALLREFPDLAWIQFGIWVRSIANNGFSEHTPPRSPLSDKKIADEF